jgi:hypothetical protein
MNGVFISGRLARRDFLKERLRVKLAPRGKVGAYARVCTYATVAQAPILRVGANFTPRHQLFP